MNNTVHKALNLARLPVPPFRPIVNFTKFKFEDYIIFGFNNSKNKIFYCQQTIILLKYNY
ncbi:unnamed protein product [marine sediment metagenome]|uniref:Uncharacterized protein n=1 Tax=marine sediment metagenome TaxID=412755 RepID=X1L817_9ZZZZ